MGRCDQCALEILTQKLRGSPVIPEGAPWQSWGGSFLTKPQAVQRAPPELTGQGEGGQEDRLDWLWLRGWQGWGGLPLLLLLRVIGVVHGNISVFDVFVSPILKRLAAHAVRCVDQPLPLDEREARQTLRGVTECCAVALFLACTQPLPVSRTCPWR